jgi:hypothetical protein
MSEAGNLAQQIGRFEAGQARAAGAGKAGR